LILDIGLRGFLPASLVDLRRVKDLESFTGEQIEARIIEMDRNRNNVVLSRRVVLEEGRKNERSEILEKLTKGMRLKGAVSSIVEFGAFVDLGGIDGLVHISELSWNHVSHPSEVVKVGDDVEVEVLEVDLKRERISLGLKQTQEDPWRSLVRNFPIGAILEGKVTKLVSFGTFVELGDGIEGLVHISEMATKHIVSPAQVAHVGDVVHVKVMDVDPERRRISLSMKSAAETLGIEIEVAEADATMIKAKPTKAELAAAKHSTEKAGNEEDAALAKDAIAADDNEAAELGVDGADDAEVAVEADDDVTEAVIDATEAAEVEAEVVAVADDEAGTAQAPIEDIIVPADDEVSDSNLAEEITEAEEAVAQVSEETVEVAEAAEVSEDDTEVAENVVAAADDAVADFESETETE
jgi:small subunit ribosomal protein S1